MWSRRRQLLSDYLFCAHGADRCRLVKLNTDNYVDDRSSSATASMYRRRSRLWRRRPGLSFADALAQSTLVVGGAHQIPAAQEHEAGPVPRGCTLPHLSGPALKPTALGRLPPEGRSGANDQPGPSGMSRFRSAMPGSRRARS
jgi:hypothetical protein